MILGNVLSGSGQIMNKVVGGQKVVTTPTFTAARCYLYDAGLEFSHRVNGTKNITATVVLWGSGGLKGFAGLNLKCNGRWMYLRGYGYSRAKGYNCKIKKTGGTLYAELKMPVSSRQLVDISKYGVSEVQLFFRTGPKDYSSVGATLPEANRAIWEQSNYFMFYLYKTNAL